MALFSPCISNSEASGARVIRGSLLVQASSDYMTRTPSSEGNRTTWTWSAWINREQTGDKQALMFAEQDNNNQTSFGLAASSASPASGMYFRHEISSSVVNVDPVNSVRDFSGFYHLMYVLDTTHGTTASRVRMYMNGEEMTMAQATNPVSYTHLTLPTKA